MATLPRFDVGDGLDVILDALDVDGGVIVDRLLSTEVVDRVNTLRAGPATLRCG